VSGIRALELGQLIAGPFAAKMLADFGADVIQIEPPTGDPLRKWRLLRGGTGQVVDVALYESVFYLMESLLPEYDAFGVVRERAGSALPGIAPSYAYRCCPGPGGRETYVLIGGNGDGSFGA
jgi:crotonobetainyl-CoA:carnitine CoA-transferase CaiB-like acyl-CoA transferase